MDFWTRLIANTPLSARSTAKDAARDPVRRRQRFEKEYSSLLHTWRVSSNLTKDVDAAETIEMRLQELTNILTDESRRPLPHPCISFCATKKIYVPIAKIATSSYNEWIIKEAVLFFATLIESEEEAFVENDEFAASLTNLLVRITGQNSIRLGSDTEIRVVELAFNITTKIRLEPEILPTWFKAASVPTQAGPEKFKDDRERFEGRSQKQDFPLFYLLMDYIHHEGKIGDFARTGLLYVIEAASSSVSLEQWIVESDLSTLMATGLGALYSQLSRKLVIDHPTQDLPPILALSDYQHPETTHEIVSSCNPDFQLHLETFLSHLLFWQDVLNHCRSLEIKSTLLEHFQIIFLQQLLYPSLLESSDVDGGSSVAVLTYLRRILESLDHPDMINLILHYLLALPDRDSSRTLSTEPSVSAARKRKSMDLASMMASKVESTYEPLLFNLVDLIQSCLKSKNQQTVSVTLQLLAAILKRHHRYAIVTLLHTEAVNPQTSQRTVGAHQQEVEFITALATSLGGHQDVLDELYESILKDSMTRVESHPCSLKLIAPQLAATNHKLPAVPESVPGAPREVPPHTLRREDPILNSMMDIFETFFINSVETNLSVTEALLDLAVCGHIGIEGWLLRHPAKYIFDGAIDEDETVPEQSSNGDNDAEEDEVPESISELDTLKAIAKCRRYPKWQASSLPRTLRTLESLADQVELYRQSIPRFDDLLQQRRDAFQTADAALAPDPPPVPSKSVTPGQDQTPVDGSRAASPARPSALEGFAQRIFSELSTPTKSRSASPRGRGDGTLASNLFGTPNKPLPSTPRDNRPEHETPTKGGRLRSLSPAVHNDGNSLDAAAKSIPASQLAAFAAIDQEILGRKVGLPSKRLEAIPLRFNTKNATEDSSKVDATGDDAQNSDPATAETVQAPVTNTEESDQPSQPTKQSGDGEDEIGIAQPSGASTPAGEKEVTVSHVITNVIVLQSFLFELAGLVQVRGSLFNEIKFA
ncbi:Retinoic acid induced 16-like protein-domain-containing protein [Microdochium trichocladiopsis]|uniref:Retinoic acid induced 16-like protein-domain-containing protein n=1 Tax=Microdochium trichocladiopsis TaxID=1682393 RepID=A0A9P8Y8I6_9PEZI|nr:Retinoic acid induced 16-like protein-domain-containing protein [Microdochium trichocladiopsis]KAH7032750.1 Retinoic acid induced 16-like protein-domain-containing protein [Microdochium trichocladiopsis]